MRRAVDGHDWGNCVSVGGRTIGRWCKIWMDERSATGQDLLELKGVVVEMRDGRLDRRRC